MAGIICAIRAPQHIAMEHPIGRHKQQLKPVNAVHLRWPAARQAQGYGVFEANETGIARTVPLGTVPRGTVPKAAHPQTKKAAPKDRLFNVDCNCV